MKLNNSEMRLVVLYNGEEYDVEAICTNEHDAKAFCGLNAGTTILAKDFKGHQFVTNTKPTGPKVRAGFTRTELSQAFDTVKNKENWKMPIDALVELTANLKCIDEAIAFFAGCHADYVKVQRDGKEWIRVRAEGYYNAVGA